MSKIQITPIGTCRIHTPLRRASARYPIEVEQRRNYGFVHTSEEALQLVRFLQGDKQFNPQVASLVARDGDFAQYEVEEWQPSDLNIVEISSAKRITSGQDAIQANYLAHHFPDFFASPNRVRKFWSLVKNAHRADLLSFLEGEETYRLLSPPDRELLASLQMEPQSFKAIKTDMAEIVDRIGNEKLLFVTHVNATMPDGEIIGLRDRLIRWVKMAAEQLGSKVFDPTFVMDEVGQANALESGGADLTHYTPSFSDAVYDEIHDKFVRPLIGALQADAQNIDVGEAGFAREAAKLEAALETGDYFAAARQIHDAISKSPAAFPLIELRGRIRSRIGDFAGAVDDLTLRGDTRGLSQASKIALVEAFNATGQYGLALEIAEDLFGEEFGSAELYRAAALAAGQLDEPHRYVGFLKQAFRMDHKDLTSALAALVQLKSLDADREAEAWRHEMLGNMSESASGALEVCLWAVANRDSELFAAALSSVARVDKPGAIDLLEDALAAEMYPAVSDSVDIVLSLGRLSRSLAERRLAIINEMLEVAARKFAEGDIASAFDIASSLMCCDDEEEAPSQLPGRKIVAASRNMIRSMSQQLRSDLRNAYKDRDTNQALGLAASAGDLLLELPDAASAYARALHDDGRTQDALKIMKRALAKNRDSFTALRWTARFASIAGDYALALDAYGKLRRSDDVQRSRIDPEIDRFFAGALPRSLKQLRIFVAAGDFQNAVSLARLISQETGETYQVDRMLDRLHSALRRKLKTVDQVEAEADEFEAVLRQIVELRPEDAAILKKLAGHLMRHFRYAEAAEIWDRITLLDPLDETARTKRERCVKMEERRSAAWRASA